VLAKLLDKRCACHFLGSRRKALMFTSQNYSRFLLVFLLISFWHLACSAFPLFCVFCFSSLSALAGLRAASPAAAGVAGRTGYASSGGLAVAASGGDGTELASGFRQTGTETRFLTRRRKSGRGSFFLSALAPRSEPAPSNPIVKITMAKNGLLGYTFQVRPRLLEAARRAMREFVILGKSVTRKTSEIQERATKALDAAERPLTR